MYILSEINFLILWVIFLICPFYTGVRQALMWGTNLISMAALTAYVIKKTNVFPIACRTYSSKHWSHTFGYKLCMHKVESLNDVIHFLP